VSGAGAASYSAYRTLDPPKLRAADAPNAGGSAQGRTCATRLASITVSTGGSANCSAAHESTMMQVQPKVAAMAVRIALCGMACNHPSSVH
jgi:hypothetical protein